MKCITKGSAPEEYTQWCASGNEDWQPAYDEIRGLLKDTLKSGLIREQGGLCCYCEQPLQMNDSHVEHVRPQHQHDVDPLDFSNMACSCQDQLEKGEPRHCGNLKQGWYEEALFINPFDLACEHAFSYTGDGRIEPARENDAAAKTTMKKLGLGIRKLNDLRKHALEPFLDEALSNADVQQFAEGYLRTGPTGTFNPFWTTVASLFAPQHLAVFVWDMPGERIMPDAPDEGGQNA